MCQAQWIYMKLNFPGIISGWLSLFQIPGEVPEVELTVSLTDALKKIVDAQKMEVRRKVQP